MSSTPGKSLAARKYSVSLIGLGESVDCDLLISSIESPEQKNIGAKTGVARCVAIINRPLVFAPPEVDTASGGSLQSMNMAVDTALVIFPPSALVGGSETTAAHVFVTGEGSLSAPKGHCAFSFTEK